MIEKISDDMLENVSGGVSETPGTGYSLQNDPLYQKFLSVWNNEESDNKSGMQSRADMLSSFKQWASSGMPDTLPSQSKNKK